MSDTHYEYMGDGYSVCIQHCELCNVYLGVNYPAFFCPDCKNKESRPPALDGGDSN